MRTLINGTYYPITDDIEVVYIGGELFPITDDGDYNWGIVYEEAFIPLHTFEVDGVIWYFTNDFQEIEIRDFVANVLPARGLLPADLDWLKTTPLGVGRYNDHFEVYYKIRGLESYHSAFQHASSEDRLISLIHKNKS